MDEKKLSLEFVTKSSNLCRFLLLEKSETLFSAKLFDSACNLAENVYSLKCPLLSKNETAALRKEASLSSGKVQMYLDALYIAGYISEAQKDSMLQSLSILKKEINI